jgi:hypothetical protein
MLNADTAPYFCTCPRCGVGGLEHLPTHSHCVNCLYVEDHYWDSEYAYSEARMQESIANSGHNTITSTHAGAKPVLGKIAS